jgi:hypothetical protein
MIRTRIPLKFKQIAVDNFLSIPDNAPIVSLMGIAGKKEEVAVAVVEDCLKWLEKHGEGLVVKDNVTPGKGLRRLRTCLELAIEQAKEAAPSKKKTP